MAEPVLRGWKAIAGMFGRNPDNFRKRHRNELIERGAIFQMPRPHKKYIWCAFPEQLRQWAARKSKKNECV